jgi:hypothetical protein
MIRVILEYLIPFLLPLAGYSIWIWYRNTYAENHDGAPPRFEEGPWPLMLFLGAILMFASMSYTALTSGGSADATYIPSRVVNGEIVPGRMVEPDVDKKP